jgi:hypothetical protein
VTERLFQIESPYYSAGIVFSLETRRCIDAAPIIFWMVGKKFESIKDYCKYKGFKMGKVEDND